MNGPLALGLVVLGLVLLTGGGESLVRGAVALARQAGVTPAVIGLTVVAIGTSLPELVVSTLAALQHQPDLAVGNVVGSNIFNIAVVLGLAALIRPVGVHDAALRLEWPAMAAAAAVLILFARDGEIDRVDGLVMLLGMGLFLAYMVRVSRLGSAPPAPAAPGATGWGLSLILVVLGLGLLLVGARVLVAGAVGLARVAGVSERVIGLTVVAAGTSIPELATSIVAGLRGRSDLALANALGSNLFNALGILGLVAVLHPTPVSVELRRFDMLWMIALSVALYPMLRTGRRVSRLEGGVLVSAYLVYLIMLLRPGSS
jgi:cation:H+ antiporter